MPLERRKTVHLGWSSLVVCVSRDSVRGLADLKKQGTGIPSQLDNQEGKECLAAAAFVFVEPLWFCSARGSESRQHNGA